MMTMIQPRLQSSVWVEHSGFWSTQVVAAVLLDPDGDALGRFGHRGACQAMATLARPLRPKRLRGRGSFRRRRRREMVPEAP